MRSLKADGFTLIELLVVIVLLGVVTSFAVLSMGTSSLTSEMQEEAKRLHALIKLAQEESIIQAKEIAMEIDQQEYVFLEYNDKKWQTIQSAVFKVRKIKEGLDLKVELESESEIIKSKKTDILRIYFLSSGEQTPFQIRLSIKGQTKPYYTLSGYFNGNLKLELVDE